MLNCFAMARYTQIKANDKTLANLKAQTIIEYIKSSENSIEMDKFIKSKFSNCFYDADKNTDTYIDNFDANWNKCNDNEKEYSIILEVSNSDVNSGELKAIKIRVEKSKHYPFIEKDNSFPMVSIQSKKFFPDFIIGRQ